jgi:succinate dehydrogenase / fumarate reductase cytochrome b subunit
LDELTLRRAEKSMAEAKSQLHPRPLSPHLQIYRPMMTMMMSFAHRGSGFALYFGMVLLAWWLIAAASGPNAYATFQWAAASWLGRLVLFASSWAVLHHTLGGIRHFIWDLGYGFGPTEREWLARATLVGSVALTILVWVAVYVEMGGL